YFASAASAISRFELNELTSGEACQAARATASRLKLMSTARSWVPPCGLLLQSIGTPQASSNSGAYFDDATALHTSSLGMFCSTRFENGAVACSATGPRKPW